jgi:NAD(P)-dependent dehydrogenase (short-subunit alcohol dehydrogenase family)
VSNAEKRIAVVTGASRGIGRAAALELARRNWRIIALARSQKALESLDDEVRALGGEATLIPIDLRDMIAIDALAAPLLERFGRIDGLAACAGALGTLTPVQQIAPAAMDETITLNYLANQRLIRALHPLLRASEAGRAVFVTSGAATTPHAYWGPYSASKAALDALVKVYAKEVEITPIRANLFSPGPTRTAMRAKAFPGEDPETLPPPEEVVLQMAPMLKANYTANGEIVRFQRG